MQLLVNFFFLAHQLRTTFGLRVLDNGVGFLLWGPEENIVDYALLAADQKATLPSQVRKHSALELSFSVHHMLICNNRCFVNQRQLFPTSFSFWESLDYILAGASTWE